jgi:hypothetical protein
MRKGGQWQRIDLLCDDMGLSPTQKSVSPYQ